MLCIQTTGPCVLWKFSWHWFPFIDLFISDWDLGRCRIWHLILVPLISIPLMLAKLRQRQHFMSVDDPYSLPDLNRFTFIFSVILWVRFFILWCSNWFVVLQKNKAGCIISLSSDIRKIILTTNPYHTTWWYIPTVTIFFECLPNFQE